MSYDRLQAGNFAGAEEEEITGELQRSMQSALEAPGAPPWAKNFSAHEEVRVHDPAKKGKRRRRIDIEIMHHRLGPRPRFRFEAKRLRDSASHRDYIGEEGLGCFLNGSYAGSDGAIGMIGYVQTESVAHHAEKLLNIFVSEAVRLCVTVDGAWSSVQLGTAMPTFRSQHARRTDQSVFDLFHALLPFCTTAGLTGSH